MSQERNLHYEESAYESIGFLDLMAVAKNQHNDGQNSQAAHYSSSFRSLFGKAESDEILLLLTPHVSRVS